VYFNVNFNAFFKLIKVHLLVSELYIYQYVRCNNKSVEMPFGAVYNIYVIISAKKLANFSKVAGPSHRILSLLSEDLKLVGQRK